VFSLKSSRTFLVAPLPPPPPPAVSEALTKPASAPRRVFTNGGKLLAPAFIPQKIAILKNVQHWFPQAH
jgi:hypothetical protein